MNLTLSNFADWFDITSLFLLFPTVLSNGLEPRNSLRGFLFPQNVYRVLIMVSFISFTLFRYLFEGMSSVFTHREFLTISVLYISNWLYLFYKLHNSANPECRLSQVAKAVANVSTIRSGKSTYLGRKGEKEIVVRKGANRATGNPYWRGTIQSEKRFTNGWMVYLADENIHQDTLSPIMSSTYMRNQHDSLDDLYQRIFQTVMTVEGVGESNVDWSHFFTKYSAVSKTKFAERAGATDDSELVGVARRIAADACCYVSGRGDFRTEVQVQLLNLCVEKAAHDIAREL